MTDTLKVILVLKIIESKTQAYEDFFARMQAQVAAEEPGTLCFEINRVIGTPGRYVMIEEYADQEAWDFHSKKQGERGVVPAMIEYSDQPPDFMFLEPAGGPLR